MAIAAGIILGLGVMVLLWKPMFGDLNGFLECIKFYFTPDVISLFRGELGEDRFSSLKLFLWILCGLVTGAAGYTAISKLFGG